MDPHQDPWVPAPRAGDRADLGGRGAGGDPWSPTVPFPRVAPAVESLPDGVAPLAPRPAASTALVPVSRRTTGSAVPEAGGATGFLRMCARAVTRLVHVTVDGVRSLVGLLVATPASR